MSIIKLNNRAVKDATAVGSITGLGNLVFISRSTASSSSSLSITSGLTSTHKEYIFVYNIRTAGYCNTTSAVNAVDFKMSSGNIDSGVIKMYGLSKS